jgi:crotonobetainyl-CoA:carnitine CoA-transferase CaiB-like acyl-CoA transferase
MNNDTGNEALRRELVAIFKTRTQAEWTAFFLEHDVPGGPIYDLQGALEDPHFLARDNVFEQDVPGVGPMRAIGTPIKVEGQDFDVRPAPRAGEHTEEVLREILGYDDGDVAALREQGVVSQADALDPQPGGPRG